MITDNYIKMCEKAKEIQEKWRNRLFRNYLGNWYWKGKKYLQIREACHIVISTIFIPKKEHIWLPTQEQLQEMVFNKSVGVQTITTEIEMFSKCDIGCVFSIFGNMNELWLAFVMYGKYNKIWTGEKWVKENK